MKVIIAGSRTLSDRALLDEAIKQSGYTITEVVQGNCPTGADLFAREWAERHGIPVESYPADWAKYGRSAGPKRNEQMARDSGAEALIALWDGKSKGTGGMIQLAQKYKLEVFVLRVDLQDAERYQRIEGRHDRSGLLLNAFTLAKADRALILPFPSSNNSKPVPHRYEQW